MKPIYKVIDQELVQRIEKELDFIGVYMKNSMDLARGLVPELSNIAITKCGFTGKHTILGLILNKGANTALFKHTNTTQDGSKILVPKRNTNKGKELSKALSFIGKAVKLFDEGKFEEELGYNPEQREVFGDGFLTMNYLRFGYQQVGDSKVFVFSGYDGYEPPKGVAEEMKISEYNKLFGRE